MLESKNLLLIFTRNPELGKVKSRLATDVGNETALDIYKFLLNHTKKVTQSLNVDKQVWYSENVTAHDIWDNSIYTKYEQVQSDDLGTRMLHAFEQGFKDGYSNIIVIGSDLHDLSTKDLDNAFKLLQNNQAVIGPATDGGFYLLGLSFLIPELFIHKDWGTNTVLNDSLINLRNYTFETLEARNDVDYLSDIKSIDVFQPFLKKVNTK